MRVNFDVTIDLFSGSGFVRPAPRIQGPKEMEQTMCSETRHCVSTTSCIVEISGVGGCIPFCTLGIYAETPLTEEGKLIQALTLDTSYRVLCFRSLEDAFIKSSQNQLYADPAASTNDTEIDFVYSPPGHAAHFLIPQKIYTSWSTRPCEVEVARCSYC